MIFGAPVEAVLQKRQGPGITLIPWTLPDKRVDCDEIKYIFLSFYGGMGPLNNLVLYRNGKVLMSESDELAQLRHDLFNLLFMNTKSRFLGEARNEKQH